MLSAKSEGGGIGLAGADANRMVEVDDEDFAVADLSGLCGRSDRIDGLVDLVRIDGNFDLDLGQEAHGVFGAAIDFRMAFLSAVSLHFCNRQTVNADGGQGVTDFFEFEWLDDRHNNFHGSYPRLGPSICGRAFSTEVHHGESHYAGTAVTHRIKCRARSALFPNRLLTRAFSAVAGSSPTCAIPSRPNPSHCCLNGGHDRIPTQSCSSARQRRGRQNRPAARAECALMMFLRSR